MSFEISKVGSRYPSFVDLEDDKKWIERITYRLDKKIQNQEVNAVFITDITNMVSYLKDQSKLKEIRCELFQLLFHASKINNFYKNWVFSLTAHVRAEITGAFIATFIRYYLLSDTKGMHSESQSIEYQAAAAAERKDGEELARFELAVTLAKELLVYTKNRALSLVIGNLLEGSPNDKFYIFGGGAKEPTKLRGLIIDRLYNTTAALPEKLLSKCNFLPEQDDFAHLEQDKWIERIENRMMVRITYKKVVQAVYNCIRALLEELKNSNDVVINCAEIDDFIKQFSCYDLSFCETCEIKGAIIASYLRSLILADQAKISQARNKFFSELTTKCPFMADHMGDDEELTRLFQFNTALEVGKKFIARSIQLSLIVGGLLEGGGVYSAVYTKGGTGIGIKVQRRLALIKEINGTKIVTSKGSAHVEDGLGTFNWGDEGRCDDIGDFLDYFSEEELGLV